MANTYYIAANIIFDLATGETRQVLMLVNKPEDASVFTAVDADTYLKFVQVRAQKIIFTAERVSPMTPGLFPHVMKMSPDSWIIKGVQHV